MKLGFIIETADSERVWNAFRLANTALDAGHTVDVFLLGDGVTVPDIDTEKFNPTGVLRKFILNNGSLYACGTCMESRNLEAGDLRPHATMQDLLAIVEQSDKTITIG